MRVLVVSDVHSNLEALTAVLEDATARGGWDAVWCLGDMVGYGPDPNGCLELLREQRLLAIAGNHDWAAVGKLSTAEFNPAAAAAAVWTGRRLTVEHSDFLASLPLTRRVGDVTLVHGTLRDPLMEYLVSEATARDTFARMETPLCLVGHSHLPFVCRREEGGAPLFRRLTPDEAVAAGPGPVVVNPGSVGQPRDGDPRAAYALYDTVAGELRLHRVGYDVAATQDKIRAAGLPDWLAARLAVGR